MKKIIIPIIVAVLVIAVLLIYFLKGPKYERPNYDYSAIIYHSVMIGIDAGTDYTYTIYKSDDSFFYIKSESYVTIAGETDQKDTSSGAINDKTDLYNIKKMIDKDSKGYDDVNTNYIYVDNGTRVLCNDLDELASKLFN